MSHTLPLFTRYPNAEGTIPHKALATLPTPVQHLAHLGQALEIPNLYIKRDDQSGPIYGGNKVRKLEFIFGEAIAQGYKEVVTLGAVGSHHVLATCLYARELGLTPAAHHFPQPITPHVLDNLRALSTTQPDLTLVGHPVALPFHQFKRNLMGWLDKRPKTYYIKGGGSSITGVLGYVNAAFELADQIDTGDLPCPDEIYVAAGTNGTLAGLILGLKMAHVPTKVIGVRVVDRIVTNAANVLAMTNATSLRLQKEGIPAPMVTPNDFELLDAYFGKGYGEPTEQGAHVQKLMLDQESITLDPTYTAKAFSAIPGERDTRHLAAKNVLYWHTLNGIDLSERIAQADPIRDLPDDYHAFFPTTS